MLSELLDELHDFLVIFLSFATQCLNAAVTYYFHEHRHEWSSYYTASLVFVISTIVLQSVIFTVRFIPRRIVRNAKDVCLCILHIVVYIIISLCIAPITSLLIYFYELRIHKITSVDDWYNDTFLDRRNAQDRCL